MEPNETEVTVENQSDHRDPINDKVIECDIEQENTTRNDTTTANDNELNNVVSSEKEIEGVDIQVSTAIEESEQNATPTEDNLVSQDSPKSPAEPTNDKGHIQWSPFMEVITETGDKEMCPLKENEDLDVIHEADDHFESYQDYAEIEEGQNSIPTEEEEVTYPEEIQDDIPEDTPQEIKDLLCEKNTRIMSLRITVQELEVMGTQAVEQLSNQIIEKDEQITQLEERAANLEAENQLLKQSKPEDSEADIYKARCLELEEKLKELGLTNTKLQETNADLTRRAKRVEEILVSKKIPLEILMETKPVPNTSEQMSLNTLKDWVTRLRLERKEVPLNLEDYLLDGDFETAFAMKRFEFKKEPKWKQTLIRKKIFKDKYTFDL